MSDLIEEYDQDAPSAPSKRSGPRPSTTIGWQRLLGLMAATLAIWLFIDSTTLQHNAQVSPVGIRRTIALDLLGPVAALSRVTQVSHLESWANGALGRNGNGSGGGESLTIIMPPVQKRTTTGHPPIHPAITTIPPNSMQNPTATDPLRVLLIGDSLGIDLGDALQNRLAATGVVVAALDAKESTGLTRPDYFNWPAELTSALPKVNPQVIVVMMGANDPQAIPGPPGISYGAAAWDVAYRHRAVSFMRLATSEGASLIWVSLPPMQEAALNAKVQHVNDLQRSAAAKVPKVIYIESNQVIAAPGGGFSAFVTKDGQNINVRTPDGIHISPSGSNVLAASVIHTMRKQLDIPVP
ncbi:MAG: DUF459 domain-containing protein [Actinomycetes bacterium]